MLYFELKPDRIWTEIVDSALDFAFGLIPEDENDYFQKPISSAFTGQELKEEVRKLRDAHRSEQLFRLTQYHWIILYYAIEDVIMFHNDNEYEFFENLHIKKIDFGALADCYFWDLDFLMEPNIYDDLPESKKDQMGFDPETFGLIHGMKPHPSEIELITVEVPIEWDEPDILFKPDQDYPYWVDEDEEESPKREIWEAPDCFLPLYGYDKDPDGNVVVNPTEALVVKATFQMAAYGLDEEQIADILNILHIRKDEGDPCPLPNPQSCECFVICRRVEEMRGKNTI